MKDIYYSAVVLEEDSRAKLLQHIKPFLEAAPFEYDDIIAHHMTINMGALRPEVQHLLGQQQRLEVTHYGFHDKCFAVRIGSGGELSVNTHPHITIAINRANGGSAKMSNDIEEWVKFKEMNVTGIVKETEDLVATK